jgi:hypothetical protein
MSRLCTMLLAAALVSGPVLADVAGKDKATGCGFRLPPDWQSYTTNWTGPCAAGMADGLGILRVYNHSKAVTAFYGRMREGKMALGVIDAPEGFLAGRFDDSTLVTSDDRNTFIAAFREASAAAKAASEIFKSQGNSASAKFYQEKAAQLAAQMD